jgi:magnesium transporter
MSQTRFGAGGVIIPNGDPDKPGKGAYLWVDVETPTEDDLSWLEATYRFHPLTIEDCRHFDQRAKVEEYDDYLFITMAVPRRLAPDSEMESDELHAFVAADYIVTVHDEPLAAIDAVKRRLLADKGKLHTSPDHLLYMIADVLVDRYFTLMEDVEDEIGRLEDTVMGQPDKSTLSRIFALKQNLVYMRRTAWPERDLFHALSGRRFPQIHPKTEIYYRDLYDHTARIYENIEVARDLLSNTLEVYLSVVSNDLGRVMKQLAIVATVFMPLSFLAGLGGMNFTAIPFDRMLAFVGLVIVMILTSIVMTLWFRRENWV